MILFSQFDFLFEGREDCNYIHITIYSKANNVSILFIKFYNIFILVIYRGYGMRRRL